MHASLRSQHVIRKLALYESIQEGLGHRISDIGVLVSLTVRSKLRLVVKIRDLLEKAVGQMPDSDIQYLYLLDLRGLIDNHYRYRDDT